MNEIIEFIKFYENKANNAIDEGLIKKAKEHFDIAVENIMIAEKILKELIERGKKNEN